MSVVRTRTCERYTPDFYLEDDDVFVEIKGFRRSNAWKAPAARKLGFNVILANKQILQNVYGLTCVRRILIVFVLKAKGLQTLELQVI